MQPLQHDSLLGKIRYGKEGAFVWKGEGIAWRTKRYPDGSCEWIPYLPSHVKPFAIRRTNFILNSLENLDFYLFAFYTHPVHRYLHGTESWTMLGQNKLRDLRDCDLLLHHIKLSNLGLDYWWTKAETLRFKFVSLENCTYMTDMRLTCAST